MEFYKNLGGNSNVNAFSIGEDFIDVRFKTMVVYRYTYKSAGKDKIEEMKRLAYQGYGLNSYIMRNVRRNYEIVIK